MPARSSTTRVITAILLVATALLAVGCAGPGPKLAPAAPAETKPINGGVERYYDMTGNGKLDYAETLSGDGQITLLRFDTDEDGNFEETVRRLRAGGPDDAADRHLIILLDSIPYGVVLDAWNAGRFRLFPPPSRVISPFPVMTDLSFSEFFGVSPSPGAESEYYDGEKLRDGYDVYAAEGNAGWISHTDYHLIFFAHAVAYLWPDIWYDHELGKIQRHFYRTTHSPYVGYSVTTSGLGATQGRDGHQAALIKLDRLCQAVMFELRGRLQITLMSDHGHCLVPSKRIPLSNLLEEFGYHVSKRLKGPQDVVVPEFGVVNYGGVYTQSPAQVASDLVGVDGVDFATYLDEDGAVVVQSHDGLATIRYGDDGGRYECRHGDPLKLLPVIEALRAEGKVGPDGFISDAALFEATKEHLYPDALQRLWRTYHGLMLHPPDVMISVQDGWHCGSALMTKLVDIRAAHGSLNLDSSSGFAMTTNGSLPSVVRMQDLRGYLDRLGVHIPGPAAETESPAP